MNNLDVMHPSRFLRTAMRRAQRDLDADGDLADAAEGIGAARIRLDAAVRAAVVDLADAGYSGNRIAAITGVSQPTVSRWLAQRGG